MVTRGTRWPLMIDPQVCVFVSVRLCVIVYVCMCEWAVLPGHGHARHALDPDD
jgi:hypothetical protein